MRIEIDEFSIFLLCCDIDQFYIKTLNINGKKVTNTKIPKEILNLNYVTVLSIIYFKGFNMELNNFRNLWYIHLSHNNLTKLPDILLRISNILFALLNYNKITNVDNIYGGIKILMIANNLIIYPPKIGKMHSVSNEEGIYTIFTTKYEVDNIIKLKKSIKSLQ